MTAGSALVFLLGRTARNRFARQLSHIRNPRYAVALVAGIAYLLLLTRNSTAPSGDGAPPVESVQGLLVLGLVLVIAWAWIYANDRRALAFTPAEVAFLFPAPVTRRALIHFKLVRAQLLVLLNTVIWTVFVQLGQAGSALWMRVLSVWLLLTTLHLHRLGAAFTRSIVLQPGRAARRAVPIAVVAAGAALVGAALLQVLPAIAGGGGLGDLGARISAALAQPLPRIALAPFRVIVAPLAASSLAEWLRAIGPAAAIAAAHYLWVVRSDAAFEEAAAEASLARARELELRRSGRRAPPAAKSYSPPLTALAPTGRPEVAILWKNIAMVVRRRRARILATAFLAATAAALAVGDVAPRVTHTIGLLLLTWGVLLAALGPQWVRNDVRSDLGSLELLRSFPVRPDALVRAEAASSALIVTCAQFVLCSIGALAYASSVGILHPERVLSLAGALLILIPAVNFVGLLLMNGAALMYPAWVNTSRSRLGGVDTLGQNMLTAVAYLLALGAACLLPLAAGSLVILVAGSMLGAPAVIAGAVIAAALLCVEGWIISGWFGRAFAGLDPSTAGIDGT